MTTPPTSPEPTTPLTTDPPRHPWWQRGWGVAAIGIVGLLVGAGIGASGSGSTKTVTTGTTVRAEAPAKTVTVDHVVVHNHTKTIHEAAPSPEPESSAEAASSGGGKSYEGNGTKSLGRITVSQPSTIHWHSSGSFFGMTALSTGKDKDIAVSSQSSSGESAVEPGTYEEVSVIGEGDWGITISPG